MSLVVTERAARKARALLAERGAGEGGALRLFVAGNPIRGYQYGVAIARRPDDDDVSMQAPLGLRVVADYDTAVLLADAELDYVEDEATQGFTVYHANALHSCHPIR